jgi:hypothetical protein
LFWWPDKFTGFLFLNGLQCLNGPTCRPRPASQLACHVVGCRLRQQAGTTWHTTIVMLCWACLNRAVPSQAWVMPGRAAQNFGTTLSRLSWPNVSCVRDESGCVSGRRWSKMEWIVLYSNAARLGLERDFVVVVAGRAMTWGGGCGRQRKASNTESPTHSSSNRSKPTSSSSSSARSCFIPPRRRLDERWQWWELCAW